MSGHDDDDDDLRMTTADRLMTWLADEIRNAQRDSGRIVLNGVTIEDGMIVWGMLAEKFETQTSLMRSLANELRETAGEFDDLEEIAAADIRTVSEALAKLIARQALTELADDDDDS